MVATANNSDRPRPPAKHPPLDSDQWSSPKLPKNHHRPHSAISAPAIHYTSLQWPRQRGLPVRVAVVRRMPPMSIFACVLRRSWRVRTVRANRERWLWKVPGQRMNCELSKFVVVPVVASCEGLVVEFGHGRD